MTEITQRLEGAITPKAPASINDFADRLAAESARLDILILSGGVVATPLFYHSAGHEGQFGTNDLGHDFRQLILPQAHRQESESKRSVLRTDICDIRRKLSFVQRDTV